MVTIRPELDGVPETALWTLWFRSLEARRDGGVLSDPLAIELVERIDYPFEERFGRLFPAPRGCATCRWSGAAGR